MEVNKYYSLIDGWKASYKSYSLYWSIHEVFDIWFDLVNQDQDKDIVNYVAKLEAINSHVYEELNKLNEVERVKAHEIEIGPSLLPAVQTALDFSDSVAHWTNVFGTNRREIVDKLNEVGFPFKPVEVDLLKRALAKLKSEFENLDKDELQATTPRVRKRKKEIRLLLGIEERQMTECVAKGTHGLKNEGGQWCSLPLDIYRKLKLAKSSTK